MYYFKNKNKSTTKKRVRNLRNSCDPSLEKVGHGLDRFTF